MAEKDAIEKAVEEQAQNDKVIEDLSDIELGLTDKDKLDLAARERYQIAVAYQTLKVRADTVRLSVTANKAVGNTKEEENFKTQLGVIEPQMTHCLRGIKEIDRQYPRAKDRMREMNKQGTDNK